MNPAPATSVRAMRALAGSAATMACGELARVAPRAPSPGAARCCWRNRRAAHRACARPSRSRPAASAERAAGEPGERVSAGIARVCCFKITCASRACGTAGVYRSGRAPPSKELERIDVERPANAPGARQLLDLRQPAVEELDAGALRSRALDEQLRVIAAGALRHGGRDRPEQPHARAAAERGARVAQESERRVRRCARKSRSAARRLNGGQRAWTRSASAARAKPS